MRENKKYNFKSFPAKLSNQLHLLNTKEMVPGNEQVYSSSVSYHTRSNYIHRRLPSVPIIDQDHASADKLIHSKKPSLSPSTMNGRAASIVSASSHGHSHDSRNRSISRKHTGRTSRKNSGRASRTNSGRRVTRTNSGRASRKNSQIYRSHSNISKKTSIKRRRRFMKSTREVRNQLFHPVVRAPSRVKRNSSKNYQLKRKQRNGKYRTKSELDANLVYIDFDVDMSKDLCLNKKVDFYEVPQNQLLKPNPDLKKTVKAITIDADNNYMLYVPQPVTSDNSFISTDKIEKQLNEQLMKIGTLNYDLSNQNSLGQNYSYHNPTPSSTYSDESKPGTVLASENNSEPRTVPTPQYETFRLSRTMSLPTNSRKKPTADEIEILWKVYLKKVIANRIRWQLSSSFPNFSSSASGYSNTSEILNTTLSFDHDLPETGYNFEEQPVQPNDLELGSGLGYPIRPHNLVFDQLSQISRSSEISENISERSYSGLLSRSELYHSLDDIINETRSIATGVLF